ncbi:MAG: DMT family transporter [Lautropia sp.]
MPPRAIVELLALALLWGSAYLFTRSAVPAFGPVPMVAVRFALASCVLLPVVALTGRLAMLNEHKARFVFLGVLFTAMPFMLISFSAQSLSAGMLSILNATAPLFGAIVARVWLKERISPLRAIGLLLGFGGVTLLLWGRTATAPGALLAVGLMLTVSLMWGFAANYSRARLGHVDPIVLATGNTVVAALLVAPLALPQWPVEAPGTRAWVEVLFMGLASSAAGMLLYFRLLARIGTVPTMSVTFMTPVVAVVAGAFYLDEPITLRTVVGGSIVLAGTALTLGLFDRTAGAAPRT